MISLEDKIKRLPNEIESIIYEYVFDTSMHLKLLLNKYPLNNIIELLKIKKIKKDKLNKIYRYGCIKKIFEWSNGYYHNVVNQNIKNLFQLVNYNNGPYHHHSLVYFAYALSPNSNFNSYWTTGNEKYLPSKPEYHRKIFKFCNILNSIIINTDNERLKKFCEKTLYDLIIGILIICK